MASRQAGHTLFYSTSLTDKRTTSSNQANGQRKGDNNGIDTSNQYVTNPIGCSPVCLLQQIKLVSTRHHNGPDCPLVRWANVMIECIQSIDGDELPSMRAINTWTQVKLLISQWKTIARNHRWSNKIILIETTLVHQSCTCPLWRWSERELTKISGHTDRWSRCQLLNDEDNSNNSLERCANKHSWPRTLVEQETWPKSRTNTELWPMTSVVN